MSSVISTPAASPVPVEPLSPAEDTVFNRIFERNFIFENLQREWNTILNRHKDEIHYAATTAKAQLGGNFGGLQPTATQFGMFLTRAVFFGLKSWTLDTAAPYAGGGNQISNGITTAAGVNNWITKANLSGTAGDVTSPVVVGKYAVHVIVAIGDFSSSPVIESFQETLNGNPQPFIPTEHQFRNSGLKYMELDTARLYVQGTTFLWQYNSDYAATQAPWEEPYFFGVSFLPFAQSKFLAATTGNYNGGTSVNSVIHY